MPPQLKTTRLGANDLISTFPAQLGNLESDIASIFGFTLDSNITESPLLLSNDGKVTKPLLRFYGRDNPGVSGVGMHITDSGALTTPLTASFESEGVAPAVVFRGGGTLRFSIGQDGSLNGSTTQDGTQTPLIPASPTLNQNLFYNGLGQFAYPSSAPSFYGVVASGGQIEIDATATPTAIQPWSTGGANAQTPTGPFSYPVSSLWAPNASPTQIQIPFFGAGQPGKWLLFCSIPVMSIDMSKGLDATVELYKDGGSVMKQNLYHAGGDPPYDIVGRVANMQMLVSATNGHYFEVYVTNNNANTGIVVPNKYNSAYPPITGTVGNFPLIGLMGIG